jgi:hypothetical protein
MVWSGLVVGINWNSLWAIPTLRAARGYHRASCRLLAQSIDPSFGFEPSRALTSKGTNLGQIGVLTEGISNFVLEWFGLVVGIN